MDQAILLISSFWKCNAPSATVYHNTSALKLASTDLKYLLSYVCCNTKRTKNFFACAFTFSINNVEYFVKKIKNRLDKLITLMYIMVY